ncbi:MAG TPA: hypothetical protein VF545_03255 [Thermoleophilaceae bacterium]
MAAGTYVVAVYPLVLVGGRLIDNALIPVLWMVTAAGLIVAGAAPLGRGRYLLPLSWVLMSLVYDALVGLDVLEQPDEDWIPVTYALVILLPAGLILLYLGRRSRG